MNGLLDAPYVRTRSDGIDFLRGLFAMWVLISHLVPWAAVVRGRTLENFWEISLRYLIRIFQNNGELHPAVLGFIVLSGYCIHRNGARNGRPFSIPGYFVRRFFRIWPVYLLAVAVGAACFLASSAKNPEVASTLSATTAIGWQGLAAKLTGISVIYPALHQAAFQGNAPLVTVMVEIWLYVLYAAVIVFMQNGGRQKTALAAIGAVYLAALAVVATRPELVNWWHNGALFSFAFYWWIGALFVREKQAPPKFIVAVAAAWLLLTAALIYAGPSQGVFIAFVTESRQILLAVIFGMLIFYVDHRQHRWYAAGSKIGHAGYSIYALHAPLLIFLLILKINYWVVMLITIGAAAAVYRLYEKPLTDYGKRLSTKIANKESGEGRAAVTAAPKRQ